MSNPQEEEPPAHRTANMTVGDIKGHDRYMLSQLPVLTKSWRLSAEEVEKLKQYYLSEIDDLDKFPDNMLMGVVRERSR